MLEWAGETGWSQIAAVSLVLNFATLGASVMLWRAEVTRRGVGSLTRSWTRRDLRLAVATTAMNAAVLVPTWWLWRRGIIELADTGVWGAVVDVLYLVMGLDLAMYVLHRAFHHGVLFRWFHSWHHTDDEAMSPITLFVMHPFEAGGFGAVTAVLMWARPVSIIAVAVFFTVNLILGTVAHVPLRDGLGQPTTGWLGGSALHHGHHRDPGSNFGFFTQVWDRLFGTHR